MADIKNIDVFQTVTSVSFEVEPNTNIININKVTTSGYSGVPNLQEVTDEGASTTNPITVTSIYDDAITGNSDSGVGVFGNAPEGTGIYGSSINGNGVGGYSETSTAGIFIGLDKGISVIAGDIVVAELNQGLTSKGLVINSGASSTGNFIELDKNGVDKLTVNQAGELTATKLIKEGGTSSQILAADGSVITAGTNITISGGTISSTGGGGGSQDLQSVTDIGAITTNTITANSITTTIDSTINGVTVGRGNIAGNVSENTAVGYQALQSVIHTTGSTGYYNTAFGDRALKSLTTGYANDAFGDAALNKCTTGTFNLAIGTSAMLNSTTATQNTAVGQYALQNSISGQKNTAIGLSALGQNTASYNTAIGSYAGGGVSSTGTENILIGYQAGSSISSGRNNLLIENQSGGSIGTGSYNIILNPKQRSGVTTGSNNTIIGCFDNTFATGLTSNVIIANGLGSIRFQSTDTGLTTVPAQTNTLINGDATGKAVVTKEYLSNSQTVFVPYTGATADVNLGLNDITAEKLIKSGGTTSQILAADGSVITAGNNITITGGQISSIGGAGGGSTVNYYLNGGTSQGTFGGTTYYEFSKTSVVGTGADFSIGTNGYIASFITDVADPSLLLIPAGNWNLEFFFSSSSAGGSPSFYVELYKYDGTTFTSIASSSANPEGITGGTAIDAYFTPLAVPETILTVNDRLAIRVFVNASSKTITLHTQNGHLCEVITTFTAGLTALNGLQAQVQNFATGTIGTDFAINSSGSTHTFNLPSASASARGVVTTSSQTFAGDKTFTGVIVASNLSGTNTGDNATNTQYSGLATSKQDTLQSTVNIKSINGNSILGSGDLTINAASTSQTSYTVLANNTNATAVPTAQVYKDIAEQTYTGSPTWTGTAPTTILANTYKWNQVGSLVTIRLSLSYNVGGSNATVIIPLPTDLPTPSSPTGFTGALDVLYYGTGTFNTSTIAVAVTPRTVLLRRNTANNGYEFLLTTGTAISIKVVHLTLQYFT